MTRSSRQLLLLAVAMAGLLILLAAAPLTRISFWAIDLYTFRAAARAMMVGADPYDVANIPRYAGDVEVGNIHNYLYAPYFALAMRPLAWLPPEAASRIWFALNLFLYIAALGLMLFALRWRLTPRSFMVVAVGAVLFPPLRTTLIIGQSTILLLFILALSLFLLRQDRPLLSGLIFSLGLFKPHLFPLLLFFLLYRRWRWLFGAGLGMLLLNLPLFNWLDNWVGAAVTTRAANLAVDQCFQMVSLTSLLPCTLNGPEAALTGAALLAAAGIMALIWLFPTQPTQPSLHADTLHGTRDQIFDRRLAVFLTLSLLLIDHTRIADQILLLLPFVVIWRDWALLPGRIARWLALFLTLLVYVLPYTLDVLAPRNVAFLLPFWYIGLSGAILGMLLLEWWGYVRASAREA
jgi:hypothetical protein